MPMKEFYTPGAYKRPAVVVMKSTLKAAPKETIYFDSHGLTVMTSAEGKVGYTANWAYVLRALHWGLHWSAALRADVRKLLEEAEADPKEST